MKDVVEQVCLAAEYQRYLISSVLNNYRDYFHIYIATLFLSTYKYLSLSLSQRVGLVLSGLHHHLIEYKLALAMIKLENC